MKAMYAGFGLAAVGVGGLVFASAASLGGLTQDTLGADVSVTASCDTDGVAVDAWSSAYDATDARYELGTFDITGIANACDGKSYKVTVANSGGTSLAEATGTLSLTSGVETFSVTGVDSEDVGKVAVTIYG